MLKKRKALHVRMNRLSLAHETPFIGKVKAIHFFCSCGKDLHFDVNRFTFLCKWTYLTV